MEIFEIGEIPKLKSNCTFRAYEALDTGARHSPRSWDLATSNHAAARASPDSAYR